MGINDAIFFSEKQLNNILLIDNISLGCFYKRMAFNSEGLMMIKQQEQPKHEAAPRTENRNKQSDTVQIDA